MIRQELQTKCYLNRLQRRVTVMNRLGEGCPYKGAASAQAPRKVLV